MWLLLATATFALVYLFTGVPAQAFDVGVPFRLPPMPICRTQTDAFDVARYASFNGGHAVRIFERKSRTRDCLMTQGDESMEVTILRTLAVYPDTESSSGYSYVLMLRVERSDEEVMVVFGLLSTNAVSAGMHI